MPVMESLHQISPIRKFMNLVENHDWLFRWQLSPENPITVAEIVPVQVSLMGGSFRLTAQTLQRESGFPDLARPAHENHFLFQVFADPRSQISLFRLHEYFQLNPKILMSILKSTLKYS